MIILTITLIFHRRDVFQLDRSLDSLIDTGNEITYDMGLDPLCGAMCEVLGIPQIINEKTPKRDPRAKLEFGTIVKAKNLLKRNMKQKLKPVKKLKIL